MSEGESEAPAERVDDTNRVAVSGGESQAPAERVDDTNRVAVSGGESQAPAERVDDTNRVAVSGGESEAPAERVDDTNRVAVSGGESEAPAERVDDTNRVAVSGGESEAPSEPQRPLLRVVRGAPSPEELAALVAVLAARAAGEEPPAPVASAWSSRRAQLRRAVHVGRGEWQASGFEKGTRTRVGW